MTALITSIVSEPSNIMNHLGETVIVNRIKYDLPTAEELSCANLQEGWSVSSTVQKQMAQEIS